MLNKKDYGIIGKNKKVREKMEENSHIVVGIEGLVGAGKTSLCRELVSLLPNSILLHGGNLYRAIVYAILSSGITIADLKTATTGKDIKQWMDYLKIEIKIENKESKIYRNGKEIKEEELQSEQSSMAVSMVAKEANNVSLYQFGEKLINLYKQEHNVIVSGRDLMKIYPKLDYHFLIVASLEERIRRKSIQYEGKITQEELRKHIQKRDFLQKEAGFYKKYDKTILLDVTDCKNALESSKMIMQVIEKGREKNGI